MNILLSDEEKEVLRSAVMGLPDDAAIVEYGSGGSTLFLAEHLRGRQELVTIEHTEKWFDFVETELRRLPIEQALRVYQLFHPVEYIVNIHYSTPAEESAPGCHEYLWPHEIADWSHIQMVFIDGIVRGSVLALTRYRCLPTTRIFLHDYIGREHWYGWVVKLFEPIGVSGTLLELRIPAITPWF
jgi:hypothetical protein